MHNTPEKTSTAKARPRRSFPLAVSALFCAIAVTVAFPGIALADPPPALPGNAAVTVAFPGIALADPPPALPGNASSAESTYQPAMDYDGDGCYPTPAIGPDGTLNPGLNTTGAVNGSCHDESDLDNTNSYSRSKCNNDWCVYLYTFYFEKDQAVDGSGLGGHRHDWEHVAVWVQGDQVQYVSTSAHGDYDAHPASAVAFDGPTHPKIVYHKDGAGTHAMRLANADEAPENHKGAWQYPNLIGWDGYPSGIRDKLTSSEADAHFGDADFPLKDLGDTFDHNVAGAMPAGISFDPRA